MRGYITSSNRRVVPGTEKFSGTTVRLQYGIDGAGMHPGERHEGWLCFTTDIFYPYFLLVCRQVDFSNNLASKFLILRVIVCVFLQYNIFTVTN